MPIKSYGGTTSGGWARLPPPPLVTDGLMETKLNKRDFEVS